MFALEYYLSLISPYKSELLTNEDFFTEKGLLVYSIFIICFLVIIELLFYLTMKRRKSLFIILIVSFRNEGT